MIVRFHFPEEEKNLHKPQVESIVVGRVLMKIVKFLLEENACAEIISCSNTDLEFALQILRTSINCLAICTAVSSSVDEMLEVFHCEKTMCLKTVGRILRKLLDRGK